MGGRRHRPSVPLAPFPRHRANMKWLHEYHFLRIWNGKLILWDYKNHTQFEVEPAYLTRLIDYSRGLCPSPDSIDAEIAATGVLADRRPDENWGWDWLSHVFHYGTCHPLPPEPGVDESKAVEYDKEYIAFCRSISDRAPEVELIKGGKVVDLPAPDMCVLRGASLWDTLARRRTCRDFTPCAVDLGAVANLLSATFGEVSWTDPHLPPDTATYGYRRTSPSAGSLQCTEPYLWAANIDGLPPGIYHYLSRRHQLEVIKEGLPEHPMGTYLCNQYWANDLPFGIFITCNLKKMWWKYPHSRAYRPMLMEVGHLSQTLNLCITALGLHPWLTGYFHDKEINDLLGASEPEEHVLLMVGGGHGTGSAYSRIRRQLTAKLSRERQI